MEDIEYFVTYKVAGFGDQKAGPYKTRSEALTQLDDIAGYEGVSGAEIAESHPTPLTSWERLDIVP